MANITLSSDKSVVTIDNKQYKASSPVVQRYISNPLNASEKALGVQISSLLNPVSVKTTTPTTTSGNNILSSVVKTPTPTSGGVSNSVSQTTKSIQTPTPKQNIVSADGKTITIDGVKYANDPTNTLVQKALEAQKTNQSSGAVQSTPTGAWNDAKQSATVQPTTTSGQGVNAWAATPTAQQGAQSYNVKAVDDLYAKILSGELKPSKDNKAWTALYVNGQATPEMQEAYRRYSSMSDEATKLFEKIKSGQLRPSKTDATWASMYKDGQATEAQKRAYAMWQEFTKNNLNNLDAITNIQQANDALNKYQASQFMESEDSADAGMLKDYGEMTSKDLLADLIGDTEAMPTAPSTLDKLGELREQHGLDNMEAEINDLQAQADEIVAIQRQRMQGAEGQRVSMGVIGGRVSEIERQENERLDAINRQINAKVNAYESKLSVVNMMMSAMQTDYQNASSEYQMKFNQKMSLINAIKGYEDEEKATASANLQIAVESLQGQDYDKLSSVQKMTLENLATKAGMPSTLLSGLIKESFKNNILAQSSREGADGFSYMDFVMQDPNTGEISTKSIQLGALATSQPTSAQLLDGEKSGYSWNGDTWVSKDSLQGIFSLPGGKYGPGVQCGEGYNILTGREYPVGHSYAEKLQFVDKSLNETGPSAGNGIVIPLTEDGVLNHGHIETVLDKSADYNYKNGTGEIYTVAYNRNGDGKLTFETWSVADLKKKYGDNWGFIPSKFTAKYQEAIGGVQQKVQAEEDYMDNLVQDYINGEDEKSIKDRITTKFGDNADNYLIQFDEIIRQTRETGSTPQQDKVFKEITGSLGNLQSLADALVEYGILSMAGDQYITYQVVQNMSQATQTVKNLVNQSLGQKLTDEQSQKVLGSLLQYLEQYK
jgi:hypothetical protein